MKTVCISLATLVILAGSAANASAQTCFGNVAINSTSPVSAGLILDSGNESRTVTGAITGGADMFFVNGTVGRTTFSGGPGSSKNFTVTGAGQLGGSRKLKACPFATYTRSSGPDDDIFQVHSNQVGVGAALGFIAAQSGGMQIVPNAALTVNTYKSTVTFIGATDTETSHYSTLGLGVGFVFNQRFSVQPIVYIPMGLDGVDPSIEIAAFLGFGSR